MNRPESMDLEQPCGLSSHCKENWIMFMIWGRAAHAHSIWSIMTFRSISTKSLAHETPKQVDLRLNWGNSKFVEWCTVSEASSLARKRYSSFPVQNLYLSLLVFVLFLLCSCENLSAASKPRWEGAWRCKWDQEGIFTTSQNAYNSLSVLGSSSVYGIIALLAVTVVWSHSLLRRLSLPLACR